LNRAERSAEAVSPVPSWISSYAVRCPVSVPTGTVRHRRTTKGRDYKE